MFVNTTFILGGQGNVIFGSLGLYSRIYQVKRIKIIAIIFFYYKKILGDFYFTG